jgi:hypothetical protein
MARALVARLEGIDGHKGGTNGGVIDVIDDNAETRLTQMALLQKQMEAVMHNMVELNAAVLVCQQTMSQLIQGGLIIMVVEFTSESQFFFSDEITASQRSRFKTADRINATSGVAVSLSTSVGTTDVSEDTFEGKTENVVEGY